MSDTESIDHLDSNLEEPSTRIFEAIRQSGLKDLSGLPDVMLDGVVVVSVWSNFADGTKWVSIIGVTGEKGERQMPRWEMRGLLQEADLQQVLDSRDEE